MRPLAMTDGCVSVVTPLGSGIPAFAVAGKITPRRPASKLKPMKRKSQWERFQEWADKQDQLMHDLKKPWYECPKCSAFRAWQAAYKSARSPANRGVKS